ERLQEAGHQQVRRALLHQHRPVEVPVWPPGGQQPLSGVRGDQRRVLGEVRSRGEGEVAGPAVVAHPRVDGLQVLALVLARAGAGEPADLRVGRERPRQRGGAAAVQPAHEHQPVIVHACVSPTRTRSDVGTLVHRCCWPTGTERVHPVATLGRSCVPNRTRHPERRLRLVTALVRGYGPASLSGGHLPGAAGRGLCPGSVPRQGRAVSEWSVARLRLPARTRLTTGEDARRERNQWVTARATGGPHRVAGTDVRRTVGRSRRPLPPGGAVLAPPSSSGPPSRSHSAPGSPRSWPAPPTTARPPRHCGSPRTRTPTSTRNTPARTGARRPSSPQATRRSCTPAAT